MDKPQLQTLNYYSYFDLENWLKSYFIDEDKIDDVLEFFFCGPSSSRLKENYIYIEDISVYLLDKDVIEEEMERHGINTEILTYKIFPYIVGVCRAIFDNLVLENDSILVNVDE